MAQFTGAPPFNPAEPNVLSRRTQGIVERLDTRRWRREYNKYEVIVRIFELYYARKKRGNWKNMFDTSKELMSSELAVHQDFYDGLSRAELVVSGYYVVDKVRDEFKTIIELGPAIATQLNDRNVWQPAEAQRFLTTTGEIAREATSIVKLVTVVAGVDIAGWSEVVEAGIEAEDEDFWASTADRIQQLDRMHDELVTMRILLTNLHQQAVAITRSRTSRANERSALDQIFGTN